VITASYLLGHLVQKFPFLFRLGTNFPWRLVFIGSSGFFFARLKKPNVESTIRLLLGRIGLGLMV
jgi:hypothetical protein